MADPILVLACAVVTLTGVPGILLYSGGTWRRLWPELAMLAGLWAVVGVVSSLTGLFLPGFAVLVAATGILMGAGVAAALAERIARHGIRMLLLAGFALLVFLPPAVAVFGGSGTWLYRDLGALDFAGALPIAVGTGSFSMLLALIRGERSDTERILALRGAMLFAVAGLAVAVGFELRVDALTPAIALNMLMTPAVAILAAAGIERVKRGRNTREGLAAGTLAGTAAALAACAYLETVTALMLGLVVGAVAEVAHRGASAAWRIATPLLIGGVTGLLYLGIFGLGPGFVYSGQPALLGQQALVVAAALGWSWLVSAAMLLPLRRMLRREAASVSRPRRRA
ncbi:ammonium transporter [Leifsonia bigeumensis]|uniref:Ammonium transporter n=1 Tax=Leifsonella bigeumensis TaxID=433643 RepID=A0ABP7FRY1_9MICO